MEPRLCAIVLPGAEDSGPTFIENFNQLYLLHCLSE